MPYIIAKQGDKWVVKNKETGRVLGTHPSRKAAIQQLRAVYVHTGGK